MGAWGHGLYQCDTAADLKAEIAELARLPEEGPALTQRLAARYGAANDPTDEDHAIFWIVLADQYHQLAIADGHVFATASALIDSGADGRVMAELGMGAKDLAKRKAALDNLRLGWTQPHPKPKRRVTLAKPERNVFASGEVWAYPTEDGNAANTYFSAALLAKDFAADGWNAFVVARTGHRLGYFAVSYIIRLHVERTHKPDLATCLAAEISGYRYASMSSYQPLVRAAAWVTAIPVVVKKLGAERLGSAAIDWDRIVDRFKLDDDVASCHAMAICNALSVYQPSYGSYGPDGEPDSELDGHLSYARPLGIPLSDFLT